MGIHNKLGQKIKGDKVPFESIKNVFPNKETIIAGIDVSVFLYQSIKTAVGAAQFHAVPNMPVTAIVNRLSALVKLLEIHNITGVFVFDGEKHKRKKVSDIRATTVENAIKKMKAIQKCVVEENGGVATESQYKQYQAAAKQAAKPRLFDIAYAINYLKEAGKTVIVGAYEADFQLVQLYTTGEIDFIISVDLDYFIYDCILMADLSINTGKCVILHRENMDEYWKQLSKRQLFLLALLS